MAQEFTIKSEKIESKINQLLPSQGGFAPGVDFSASTMVIPVVDLTEVAEGSSLRADLQTSVDVGNTYTALTTNTNSDLGLTPGFYSCNMTIYRSLFNMNSAFLGLRQKDTSSGAYTNLIGHTTPSEITNNHGAASFTFQFNVFLKVGFDLNLINATTFTSVTLSTRQIADVNGNLTNPLGFT